MFYIIIDVNGATHTVPKDSLTFEVRDWQTGSAGCLTLTCWRSSPHSITIAEHLHRPHEIMLAQKFVRAFLENPTSIKLTAEELQAFIRAHSNA